MNQFPPPHRHNMLAWLAQAWPGRPIQPGVPALRDLSAGITPD